MKIRFIIPEIWHGGGPRNIYNLTMQLTKNGHDASVLAFTDLSRIPRFLGGSKSKPTIISDANVKYFWHPLAFVNHIANKASGKIPWLIPTQLMINTSSLLALVESAVYIATAWQTAFPVLKVSGMEGHPGMYFVQAYETTFSKHSIYKHFANKTYIYPLIRFTQSVWLKRFLEENYAGRTHYIGMGIDHDVFCPAKVIQHKPRILTIARTDPNKGFNIFIEAIRCLRKMRNDFEVVIIGEKAAVDSQEMDFPYKFAGWITKDQELANLYQGSIFVSTGRHEALPMPPLEAMACAATVVITDTEGAREYTVDNQNCLLAPIDDAKAIASRINEALSNNSLREELTKSAISTASRYRWDMVARKLEEVIKKEGLQ
jgi:glycosyltransferase involved in cell wall biosynthesis